MNEDMKLTWFDILKLVHLVKDFEKFYLNHPVIAISSSSVLLFSEELMRLSEKYGLDVEKNIYNHQDGSIYDQRHVMIEGIRFESQDTIKEKDE